MREVIIAPQTEGKGRSFQALQLASVEADALWPGGQTATEIQRPVWAMFAGSDPELRAFTANLQTGRKAQFPKYNGYTSRKDEKVEFLKSAGYQFTWQREAEGSMVTVFLPDLFRLDPGMVDPDGARFVCLPTAAWARSQKLDTLTLVRHAATLYGSVEEQQLVDWCPLAFLFAAYLDRRTRCPLLSDGRFYLQLLLACLDEGLASFPATSRHYNRKFGETMSGFKVDGTEDVGLVHPLAFRAGHADIERVLADQVQKFFEVTR